MPCRVRLHQTGARPTSIGMRTVSMMLLALTACGDNDPYQLPIGGWVSGLDGTGLVLQNNGGDELEVAADGSFEFPASLAHGSAYEVTVAQQPSSPPQSCVVTNGAGTVDGPVSDIVVTCRTVKYALDVTKTGAGTGNVTSTGIDCGATCSASYASGTVVTLTATPDSGSLFAGWSGECTGTDTCVVTVDAAMSVTAMFAVDCPSNSITFDYTGEVQQLALPACVTSINITAYGAAGGNGGGSDAIGGLGGLAQGTLAVSGGPTLYVNVGQRGANTSGGMAGVAGSFNGGGAGGTSLDSSGGQPGGAAGGGASDVRVGGSTLADRVIVAGGGGGAGGGCSGSCPAHGGAGGGLVGGDGVSYALGIGYEARGGTQTAGGARGSYAWGTGGTDGALGSGGDGWGEGYSGGGGGGGGLYGGGGGSCHFESGGGGGASYVGTLTSASTTAGARTGDGSVTISW